MAASPTQSPSSLRSRRSRSNSSLGSNLSLDLSIIPPLVKPAAPSNTLLITNLDDLSIFRPENLQTIRNTVNQHVAIYSWSPLKSFRRIIVTFYDITSAEFIKQTLDGETIMNCRVRVYFGAQTDITTASKLLEAPKVDKLFFISPPPSPPCDWEVRHEDPPNKQVHAEDLAHALARLHANDPATPNSDLDFSAAAEEPATSQMFNANRTRSRSTTLVFHPEQNGNGPPLPAISVEDTEIIDSPEEYSPMEDIVRGTMLHTSRPPMELMQN